MEPRQLLGALMARAGENTNSLAQKLNRKPGQTQIWNFLHGKARRPDVDTVKPLADHFGVPLEAFYDPDVAERVAAREGLKGLPNLENRLVEDVREVLTLGEARASYLVRDRGTVPVVGTAQLGDNGHFYELGYPVGHGDGYLEWPTRDEGAYSVRCKGDSMKPRIRHGEFAVIEPGHQVTPGDEVLVRAKDGRVMVKQFAYEREGVVYLDSVNEAHPRISIPAGEIAVMHYLAGIAKSALWHRE